MQSNIIKITGESESIEKILCETQKTAKYAELNAKQSMRTRLIRLCTALCIKAEVHCIRTDLTGNFKRTDVAVEVLKRECRNSYKFFHFIAPIFIYGSTVMSVPGKYAASIERAS